MEIIVKKIISVRTMRESDAYTIKNFTDSKTLMHRAGEAVFKSFPWHGRVAVVCGSGNNAGDGYVLALLLKKNGINCTLFLVKNKFSADGLYYYEKCKAENIESTIINENTAFDGYDSIADCILGTGFKGEVSAEVKTAVDKINSSGKTVVSVDINSGLNGDFGVQGECVKSDLTVSVGFLKTGFYLGGADSKIKRVVNCDIGIKLVGEAYTLIEKDDEFVFDAKGLPVETAELPKEADAVEILRRTATQRGIWLDCGSVLTNGEETYIFESGAVR